MPLIISDEVLKQAGLTEAQAKMEFACRMFDAGRLTLHQAARIAGLERHDFEDELAARDIAIYRPTLEDVMHDLEVLKKLERRS